jgi:hypothetical protein
MAVQGDAHEHVQCIVIENYLGGCKLILN